MNVTAHFIQDRAQTLVYEAKQFPETSNVILEWFYLAMVWAEKHGFSGLLEDLSGKVLSIGAGILARQKAA